MAAIGLDLGTTSIKLCVLDCQGNILSSDKRQHEQNTSSSSGIQEGQKIIELALKMLTDPSRRWLKVTDVYISGQMHGVVLWSDEDIIRGDLSSLSPFHSWIYRNEQGIIDEIESFKSEGTQIHEGFGSATLFELMKNNYNQRYNRCGTIMDLLACVLTGSKVVKMSEQLAESWGLTVRGNDMLEWDDVYVKKMEKLINLPTITEAPAQLGKCVLEGLENINVHLPVGDLQASVCSIAGQSDHKFASDVAFIVIGTSAQLCTIQSKSVCSHIDLSSHPAIQRLSFNKTFDLLAACAMNGGNALEKAIRLFAQWTNRHRMNISEVLFDLDGAVSEKLTDRNVKVTSIRFLPERYQDGQTGLSISGIQENTNLNDILAAVSVGIVDNLFSLFPCEVLQELGIKRVSLIGEANLPRFSSVIDRKLSEFEISTHKTQANVNASLGAILLNM